MKLLENIFYINLDKRVDRKIHVEQQLHNIGCHNFERFPAINMKNGAIGCSMSHLQCLKLAKERNWEYVFIVEDDILFLNPELFKTQIERFIQTNNSWDVILVAGNNFPPFEIINTSCIQVHHCQTTTGYIVHKHYYNTLINNIHTGIQQFLLNQNRANIFAIDQWWFQLQKKDKWFLLTPIIAIQKEGHSDIENKVVNYRSLMTDYEKKRWFIRNANDKYELKPEFSKIKYI
jgi:GR25 family glycosyltransferase involved in LPS biosynthesis